MEHAQIHSIFCSIQGEGIFVGYPQIFIRFSGCNLRCRYCDTPDALSPSPYARLEKTPFSGRFKQVRNPVTTHRVTSEVIRLAKSYGGFSARGRPALGWHSISLTGGEPLLHTQFLTEFLPQLKSKIKAQLKPSPLMGEGRVGVNKLSHPPLTPPIKGGESVGKIFLETNGTLPDELARVLKWIDIVSMDIKTPSTTGEPIDWIKTCRFLKLARLRRVYVYVKVLVGQRINVREINKIRELVSSINRDIPVVIQPISRHGSIQTLMKAYHNLKRDLRDVRIIPQMHKLMGWR